MNKTQISWTELSWNTFSGCTKISDGCKHCYACTLAENKRGTPAFPNGFDLTIRPHKMREQFKIKTPSMIFVNSMSDFFFEGVPDSYRLEMLKVMEDTPQHVYQVLTKRANAMHRFCHEHCIPPNVWLGVTVENQAAAWRAEVLQQVDIPTRFISVEPLLSRIKLPLDGIAWVIVGGESGSHIASPTARRGRALVQPENGKWIPLPAAEAWVLDIQEQCDRAGVAFFFKQWGGPRPTSGGKLLQGRVCQDYPARD